MKKKLFFGLALSPTILVAPMVVSCTDSDDKKTKEINKENIEKYSSLVNEIQLAYQKSNPNTPIFEGKTIADIFTEQLINYLKQKVYQNKVKILLNILKKLWHIA
ncbi:hypothetical protein [Mycoplasma anserisalpingitidis]|uniref:hypothetical protein n=1 Tax=Mycoplasma anserisalpingitidis TaxID=519450 RepID=UPI0011B14149|nr:hypothetical protein [Mycoplasma anserisalpingitidis]QDY87704.1 hypothetical protein FOY45_02075 [Mycoplasma anserisalpingitidis]UCU26581.1 hypothetical protein K7D06_03210 [Mycoplasma anserisalpingitidis]UCU27418.1 hypothetical protein K9O38_03875 [Mycoplasma anserisalpingitidis]